MKTRVFNPLILLAGLAAAQFAPAQAPIVTPQNEPVNLSVIKSKLKEYHGCDGADCYTPQLERQIDTAIGLLNKSVAAAKPGEKLAVVLDIDETSLSNWAVTLHDDYAYVLADWNWCSTMRCGKAIPGTLRLFKEAENEKVAVFFITGRPESQRTDTEENLRIEGYNTWQQIYLRPDTHASGEPVAVFKAACRKQIVDQGYRIVLNVGDQMSDLVGEPMAEHSVKLPNPFYFIP